jgi:hypothetical protein
MRHAGIGGGAQRAHSRYPLSCGGEGEMRRYEGAAFGGIGSAGRYEGLDELCSGASGAG